MTHEEDGKNEVLVFPVERYQSIDIALEKCKVYRIENTESFESFNHLMPSTEGVYLSELGYFFAENFYNEMNKLLMN